DSIISAEFREYTGRYHYSWALRHVLSFAQTWRVNNSDIPPYEWIFDFMKPRELARIEVEEVLEQAEAMAELQRGVSGDYLNYSFRKRDTLAGLQCADLVAWTHYQFALEKFRGTPVDSALYMSSRGKRLPYKMPHRSFFVLLDLFHRDVEQRCGQHARIERLSAARGIKRSAVQRHLPYGFAMRAREFADLGY